MHAHIVKPQKLSYLPICRPFFQAVGTVALRSVCYHLIPLRKTCNQIQVRNRKSHRITLNTTDNPGTDEIKGKHHPMVWMKDICITNKRNPMAWMRDLHYRQKRPHSMDHDGWRDLRYRQTQPHDMDERDLHYRQLAPWHG